LNLSPKRAVKRKSIHRMGGAMRPAQNILNMTRDYKLASAIGPVTEPIGLAIFGKISVTDFCLNIN
jgi:hypothetical protein